MRERWTRESPRFSHLGSLLLLVPFCACGSTARTPEPPSARPENPEHESAQLLEEEYRDAPPPLPGGRLTARLISRVPVVLFAQRPEYLASHLSLAFPGTVRPERALLVQLQIAAGVGVDAPHGYESDCPPSQLCLTLPGNSGGRFAPWLTEPAPLTLVQVRALREQARIVLASTAESFAGRAALHLGLSRSDDPNAAVGPAYLDALGDAELQMVASDAQRQATACVTAPTWVGPPSQPSVLPPDSHPAEFRAIVAARPDPSTKLRVLHLKSAGPGPGTLSLAFACTPAPGQDPSRVLTQIQHSLESGALGDHLRTSVLPGTFGLGLEVPAEHLVDSMKAIRDVCTSTNLREDLGPSPTGPGPDLGACNRYQLEHAPGGPTQTSPPLLFYLEGILTGSSPEFDLVSVTSSRGAHL